MEGEGLVASALPRRRAGAANGRARRRWMRGAMAPPGGREGTRQRRRPPEGGTRTPPGPAPVTEPKPRGITRRPTLRPPHLILGPLRFAS